MEWNHVLDGGSNGVVHACKKDVSKAFEAVMARDSVQGQGVSSGIGPGVAGNCLNFDRVDGIEFGEEVNGSCAWSGLQVACEARKPIPSWKISASTKEFV